MNAKLKTNLENRDKMIEAVREEIIGPVTNFDNAELIHEKVKSENIKTSFFYHEYADVKEEIIVANKPSKKYAAGLLYPQTTKIHTIEEDEDELSKEIFDSTVEEKDPEHSNEEVSNINPRELKKQSSMGFTFAVPQEANEISISLRGGQYEKYSSLTNLFCESVQKIDSNYIVPWWVRKSVTATIKINLNRKDKLESNILDIVDLKGNKIENYNFVLYSYIRKINLKEREKPLKIITITLSNETSPGDNEEKILFQSELIATLDKNLYFEEYPNASDMDADITEEDKKFELLYLNERNYAFGHDCSTIWQEIDGNVSEIRTTFLPEYEIKTMTPDITVDGKLVEIHHASLAGAKDYTEIQEILAPLINGYKKWYQDLSNENVPKYYENVKKINLEGIKQSIERIEKGLNLLKNEEVLDVFRLANLSMFMQMNNGKNNRKIILNSDSNSFSIEQGEDNYNSLIFNSDLPTLFSSIKDTFKRADEQSIFKRSKWRGFQIAFLLQSLDSIINKESKDREIVDLIWFPTGGGKTEAYLAVAAFSMFYRRALNPFDTGVDVIMRYTLRLLTADQFQRSSRLICSMDFIRSFFSDIFGKEEFSIGLWVGSNTTPNNHKSAKIKLDDAEKKSNNQFIIESCPWCSTEMRVIKDNNNNSYYMGYKHNNNVLHTYCPDKNCHFHKGLPVYFIDEQLYKKPPTFLIGTIDKFVQLTWKPEARSLFGLDNEGKRIKSPPNMIIQDELHLISGPLGSLAGIYEVLIEEMSTDRRSNLIKPKILSATATIKASEQQIKSLFGKKNSKIFPPSGLDINDNFFSTVQLDNDTGKHAPGRKYIGVYPSTQGKLQTQVQTFSSLITKTDTLPDEEKDPFFTILSFYNSINDIGKAKVLLEQDIKNNIDNHYKNIGKKSGRRIREDYVKELTSRLNSSDVSRFISELKTPFSKKKNQSIDVCLASNIIEVGVDIDRLSLMTINGQPKSSAQYIQVSGRIGRKTHESPGLVVTLYNPQNSSDKSHYEHFVEYHQKLYSQVEVSSVTPFSRFSINRGLPAILIAYIRQCFSLKETANAPNPDFFDLEEVKYSIVEFYKSVRKKCCLVDKSELEYMDEKFNEFYKLLTSRNYPSWEFKDNNDGFMARMTEELEDIPEFVQPIIFSMRNVDSSSRLVVKDINHNKNKEPMFKFD